MLNDYGISQGFLEKYWKLLDPKGSNPFSTPTGFQSYLHDLQHAFGMNPVGIISPSMQAWWNNLNQLPKINYDAFLKAMGLL